jgi:hypothetical protein
MTHAIELSVHRIPFVLAAALLAVAAVAGCSYESSLSDVTCNEEGERGPGRVCQDGHWVVVEEPDPDASTDADDIGPPPDIGPNEDTDPAEDTDPNEDTGPAEDTDPNEDSGPAEDTGPDADRDTGPDADAGGDTGPDADPGECTPGETEPCYNGPQGTAGVGACSEGTRTCTAQATWGACSGEVTPSAETCGSGGDEDCDGLVGCEDPDCAGQSCGADGVCSGGACCTPQSDQEFCDERPNECGLVSGTDNCGVARTDVDCGACDYEPCAVHRDCHSGFCSDVDDLCYPAHCTNGDHDDARRESDVDCGGPCPGCPLDASCTVDEDCQSLSCHPAHSYCKSG